MVGQFEQEGFAVEGAHEVAAGLTLPRGALGQHLPEGDDLEDLATGFHVAGEIGRLDIGQGVVVCRGLVLAVEAQEGTDAMLERCADKLSAALRGAPGEPKGVLVKRAKPNQEERVDLPTIGVATVEGAGALACAGLAAEAARTPWCWTGRAVIEAADRLGLFIFGHSAQS